MCELGGVSPTIYLWYCPRLIGHVYVQADNLAACYRLPDATSATRGRHPATVMIFRHIGDGHIGNDH